MQQANGHGGRQAWVQRGIELAYVVIVALFVFRTLGREPLDDSYFFKRISRNLLEHGTLAWNVGEAPVHGNTSQLFQVVAALITLITDDYYIVCLRVACALCVVVCFVWANRRLTSTGVSVLAFAATSPIVLFTLVTGMETSVALSAVAVLLILLMAPPRALSHWSVAPTCAAAIYLLRPDAVVLALGALLAFRWRSWKQPPVRELLVFCAILGASLLAFRLYYGTALPIPFYAKTQYTTTYGATLAEKWMPDKISNIGLLAITGSPLLIIAIRKLDRINIGLLFSSSVFVLYHYLSTIEINGNYARFYAPAIPLLAAAAYRGLALGKAGSWLSMVCSVLFFWALLYQLVEQGLVPNELSWFARALPSDVYWCLACAGAFLIISSRRRAFRTLWAGATIVSMFPWILLGVQETRSGSELTDRSYLESYGRKVSAYRGLDILLSCFGDRLHVYHSEIGVPGVAIRNGKITDLAGLFTPRLLQHPEQFDSLCQEQRPVAIFLPEPNSNSIRQIVENSACLSNGYKRVTRSRSALFIRTDLSRRYLTCRQRHALSSTR